MIDTVTWIVIAACVTQSAMFSGLNLAVFSISRLRLEAAAGAGDPLATRVLALRRNANFTLATILWGNTAVNVLLALLANSVLAGVSAFFFSTIVLTFLGEIFPQAIFLRRALRMAVLLTPALRFYKFVLYPVAQPTGWLLDRMVGEQELRRVLTHQGHTSQTELGRTETTGAVNFLALDDIPVGQEGEILNPQSIVTIPVLHGRPLFPEFSRHPDDPFLKRVDASGKKWVVLVDDMERKPQFVLNAHYFLRAALLGGSSFDPLSFCHHPLIVHDSHEPLDKVLRRLSVQPEHAGDDVVDKDIILVWSDPKRIITGSDLLGRLLRGIARLEWS
jgi:metal transporter CNNM